MIFPDRGDRYLSEPFWNGGDEVESKIRTGSTTATAERDNALIIPDDVFAKITQHGAAAYPDECCGALIGEESGQVLEALALSNTTSDERRRRFLIGPDAYLAAERHASKTGRTLIGFYHSHPNHPAVPSAFDLAHAWPNLHYLILSVRGGRPEEARTWRLKEDRSSFDEAIVTAEQPQRLRA
jgi:proteasome lid subunit RPN8/RPN11